ncbi:hypothetical protein CEQ90_14350 [Lewinellaceae bacterium SD302]|nr:hypothetical protein CEQ90_14350 [Lewinellaceae bacterium SD302]
MDSQTTTPTTDLPLTLLLSGVVGMLVLAVSLVIFFIVYQRRIQEQQRLRQEEEKKHQKELLKAAIDVQEEERSRIAADLHDEIGSKLSAVRLFIGQLTLDEQRKENVELRNDSLDILGNILNSARRITHDLFPPELQKFGLFAAAEDLCERIDRGGKISVTSKVAVLENGAESGPLELPASVRVPKKTELALYRVLQEMINNTIKHANAQNILVAFHRRDNQLLFTYQDDGTGIETKDLKPGLGLKNIETRVTLVGGKFEFISAPGQGLKLNVSVPISHWKED